MNIFCISSGSVWPKAALVLLSTLGLLACSVIGKPASPPAFYALDGAYLPTTQGAKVEAPAAALTLIITPPTAASGYDSQRLVYVREAHQLEYFAHSEWVDPPARMLGPLLVSAAEQTGAFAAVLLASGTAAGDLRLTSDILQLQHNFQMQPSRVQFTLRVYLSDEKSRRVLAWKTFQAQAIATSDSPQGGVAAANAAVQQVLAQVAQFLVDRPR